VPCPRIIEPALSLLELELGPKSDRLTLTVGFGLVEATVLLSLEVTYLLELFSLNTLDALSLSSSGETIRVNNICNMSGKQ
jgi:hypothetical protein